MEKDMAIPIELDVWQKTSEYAIIEQYDDSMVVRFQYWNEKQETINDKIAVLMFTNVYAVRFAAIIRHGIIPKKMNIHTNHII